MDFFIGFQLWFDYLAFEKLIALCYLKFIFKINSRLMTVAALKIALKNWTRNFIGLCAWQISNRKLVTKTMTIRTTLENLWP